MIASRRPLGDMLAEIASGALDALASASDLRVRSLAMTLPVEIGLRRTGGSVELLGDLPRAVTRTEFDVRPGRLEILWVEEVSV